MFLPIRIMAGAQFAGQILYAQALAGEQDDEMIEHVRTFVDHALIAAVGGFDDQFQRFLTHFLGHTVETVAEKTGGITALWHFFMTLLDKILQFGEKKERIALVGLFPAGVGTFVTDGTGGVYPHQKGVIVTVGFDVDQFQKISGGLTFGP